MAKVRQDAWSHEDDLLLAETVLRHVRDGSTQLNAFDEVGDKLNRTSAACGFRWNAEVRKKYDSAMDLAKRQRKEKKRAMVQVQQHTKNMKQPMLTLPPKNYEMNNIETEVDEKPVTIDSVIHFLMDLKKEHTISNHSKMTLDQVNNDNNLLREHISELEKQLARTEHNLASIQEDYQVFVQIMDRARKMTVLDDQGTLKPPSFRMDKNGNLEQLTQGLNT